jgi:flagellar basal-body rod protein FlgC
MNAIEISLSGLDVEWRRLEIIAQNLANMNTTRTESGDVYRPLRLVSGPLTDFNAMLQAGAASVSPTGVRVMGVEPQADALRRMHEPSHPHADGDGFVTYPNVDHASEMTLMIRASRAYEANLAAVNMAREMYSRALEIGRQS